MRLSEFIDKFDNSVSVQISDSHETKETNELKRYLLLVSAEGWNHDADEWLGIYVNDDEVREAYSRYIDWFEAQCEKGYYNETQKLMIYQYNLNDDVFEVVNPKELND